MTTQVPIPLYPSAAVSSAHMTKPPTRALAALALVTGGAQALSTLWRRYMSTPTPPAATSTSPAPAPSFWHLIGAALAHEAAADLAPPADNFLAEVEASKGDKVKQAADLAALIGAWAAASPTFVGDIEADAAAAVRGLLAQGTAAAAAT